MKAHNKRVERLEQQNINPYASGMAFYSSSGIELRINGEAHKFNEEWEVDEFMKANYPNNDVIEFKPLEK